MSGSVMAKNFMVLNSHVCGFFVCIFFFFFFTIYLTVPGLSYGVWDLVP